MRKCKDSVEAPATPVAKSSISLLKRPSPFRSSPLSIHKKKSGVILSQNVDPRADELKEMKEKIRKVKLAVAYEDELKTKKLASSIQTWKDVTVEAFQRLMTLIKDSYPDATERNLLKSMGISPVLLDLSDDEDLNESPFY